MSRRTLSADEPGCTWEYGWDPGLQTFHARLLAGLDTPPAELIRFGTRVREIESPDALMYLMGMRLPADRLAALEHDRLTDSEEVEDRAPARGAARWQLSGAAGMRMVSEVRR